MYWNMNNNVILLPQCLLFNRKSLLPDEPDRIDEVNVVGRPNARGRLITGSKMHGVGKKYVDFYRPDSDGKFR